MSYRTKRVDKNSVEPCKSYGYEGLIFLRNILLEGRLNESSKLSYLWKEMR